MNKTPRTDDREFAAIDVKPSSRVIYASFARQLETELADKDKQLADARADVKDRDNALAAIMAVLPDSAKPCDAPDLIKHFKSQMSAFGSEYIRIEKQLKEVRTDIEIMTGKLKTEREFSERRGKLIEQMREALQWYKEQVSSCNRNGDVGELARDRLAKDVGKRAEAALAAERG